MPISYKPLWKTLIDKEMTKKALGEKASISKSTLDKMSRGEHVSMLVVEKICASLKCNLSDVIEYVEEAN